MAGLCLKALVLSAILLVEFDITSETQDVQLRFRGQLISTHGLLFRGMIGEDSTTTTGNAVECQTHYTKCCRRRDTGGSAAGNWFFPNGSVVPSADRGWDFYRTRGPQAVHLHRRRRGGVSGIYRCRIPDSSGNDQDLYVGIYTADTGRPNITSIQFEVINVTAPTFTLTCISEGGPVEMVQWQRDGRVLQDDSSYSISQSTVVDTESAIYHHTLTVTGRLPGEYVISLRPLTAGGAHVNTMSIHIRVTPPPGILAHQISNTNAINVSWTVDGPSAECYIHLYYQAVGSQVRRSMEAQCSPPEIVICNLHFGVAYSITMVAYSQYHLPSDPSDTTVVTLITPTPFPSADMGGYCMTTASPTPSPPPPDIGGFYTTTAHITVPSHTTTSLLPSQMPPQPTAMYTEMGSSSLVVAGAAVGGVLAVILLVGVAVLVVIIAVRKRGHLKDATMMDYDHRHEQVMMDHIKIERDIAPVIEEFPEDTYVKEGEMVSLQVEMQGTPPPTLTWYFNSTEVVADYSLEMWADGSLTIPSVEPRHAGVYRLVATNDAGTVSREVTVAVLNEDESHPLAAKIEIHPIPVEEFGEHVKSNHENNNYEFKNEFQSLDTGGHHPVTVGVSRKNEQKNRFVNITVYDDNRVVLKPIMGHEDCQDGYINASYVDGYSFPNKFIATQAPLPTTVVDFWRLVWQEKSQSIVMVTNIKEGNQTKCKQYWPDSGSQHYGPFMVTITGQQILANYTTRTFQVKLSGSSERPLKVTQFHFTAWPDHGVPAYASSTLEFHRKANSHWESTKGPMLIHCSAGVGRTGTFVAIDYVLEQVEKGGVVDIAGTINKIRQQRMKLVQTPEQYTFIHDAILEAITCGDTQIPSSEFSKVLKEMKMKDHRSGETGFEVQFHVLEQVSPKPDQVLREVGFKFPHKNRSMDNVPPDLWRVVLKGEYPGYIHATYINGYQQRKAFIIAEGPMESTCRDFWKMVYDQKCGAIVMLSDLTEGGEEVCYQYWPVEGSSDYGEMQVEALSTERREDYVIKNFTVIPLQSETEAYPVVQFHVMNWNADGKCSYINTIIDVIGEMAKVQRKTGNHPVVVHCSDTVSRSGMFCAIATAIERCKVEGVVDVFQVVKALRTSKPGAVPTVEQYQFIFDVVLLYLDSFNTYANFK